MKPRLGAARLVVATLLLTFCTASSDRLDYSDEATSSEESAESSILGSRKVLYRALAQRLSKKTEHSVSEDKDRVWIVPPDPQQFAARKARDDLATTNDKEIQPIKRAVPTLASDAQIAEGDAFRDFDKYTDRRGIAYRPRSRSPFTKPGLWEPNPDNPHNRDHANKYYYHPESVGVDWLNGQIQWGGHWAVPAAGVGGTAGMSTVHFPTIGNFLNIPDDYD